MQRRCAFCHLDRWPATPVNISQRITGIYMLTAAQQSKRDGHVTASFLPALIAGKGDRIVNEWRRLIGDPSYALEDTSDNWPMRLGDVLESFILDWHERKTGHRIIRRGHFIEHPDLPWLGCTL